MPGRTLTVALCSQPRHLLSHADTWKCVFRVQSHARVQDLCASTVALTSMCENGGLTRGACCWLLVLLLLRGSKGDSQALCSAAVMVHDQLY
jgi:hypothetical protein